MGNLLVTYLIKNVLHYRKKYAIVFALILVLALFLTMTTFFYVGELASSKSYARYKGDLQVDVDFQASDVDHEELSRSGKISLREDIVFSLNEGNPHKLYELAIVPGKMMSDRVCELVSAVDYSLARDVYGISAYRGSEPGPGQIILANTMEEYIAIGDVVTFVYKDSDDIYGSEVFNVSGFYLKVHECEGMAFLDSETLSTLDPARLPSRFVVYDVPREVSLPPMTKDQSDSRKERVERVIERYYGDKDFARAHSELTSAYDAYRQAQELVGFFVSILSVFIICLCVVCSISIVNVLFVTIIDRVKIVGMMFSFGLGRFQGFALLAAEVFLFGIVATAAGIVLAIGLSGVVNRIPIMSNNEMVSTLLGGGSTLPMLVSWESILVTLFIGTFLPFLISLMSVKTILKGEIIALIQRAR
jgi:hypothetical protein